LSLFGGREKGQLAIIRVATCIDAARAEGGTLISSDSRAFVCGSKKICSTAPSFHHDLHNNM